MTDPSVPAFLDRFHEYDSVDRTFTEGCCYWFAVILHTRFPESYIVYDPTLNHFATKIGDRVFDVTGDVTEQAVSGWEPWDAYDDLPHRRRIARDCINF